MASEIIIRRMTMADVDGVAAVEAAAVQMHAARSTLQVASNARPRAVRQARPAVRAVAEVHPTTRVITIGCAVWPAAQAAVAVAQVKQALT